MFPTLLQHLRVARCGPGRPRTTPDALLGDKALLRPHPPPAAALPQHHDRHPRTLRPDPHPQTPRLHRWPTTHLRRQGLPRPKRRPTVLQHRQAVARPGHPIRQAHHRLPRSSRPARHHHLAQGPLETRPRCGLIAPGRGLVEHDGRSAAGHTRVGCHRPVAREGRHGPPRHPPAQSCCATPDSCSVASWCGFMGAWRGVSRFRFVVITTGSCRSGGVGPYGVGETSGHADRRL